MADANGIGGYLGDKKTLTNKLGLRTKDRGLIFFGATKKRHTHNTFSFYFILFGDVFFWVKHFRQENRSNFTSEKSSKRIPTSASHLRQSFEMEVSIGLELEEVILISNGLSSPNYMKLGHIKIKNREHHQNCIWWWYGQKHDCLVWNGYVLLAGTLLWISNQEMSTLVGMV